MKKLLLIAVLSLSPIITTVSINCVQTTQQMQQEEAFLRAKCSEIKMSVVAAYGEQALRSGIVCMYQSEYLRSVGTPVAQKLLTEMGQYGL